MCPPPPVDNDAVYTRKKQKFGTVEESFSAMQILNEFDLPRLRHTPTLTTHQSTRCVSACWRPIRMQYTRPLNKLNK